MQRVFDWYLNISCVFFPIIWSDYLMDFNLHTVVEAWHHLFKNKGKIPKIQLTVGFFCCCCEWRTMRIFRDHGESVTDVSLSFCINLMNCWFRLDDYRSVRKCQQRIPQRLWKQHVSVGFQDRGAALKMFNASNPKARFKKASETYNVVMKNTHHDQRSDNEMFPCVSVLALIFIICASFVEIWWEVFQL